MTQRRPAAPDPHALQERDADSTPSPRWVSCPQCKGDSLYATSNPYRPFCGLRCRDIDFGAWADENFRVPDQPDPDGSIDKLQ